ncbi:hypothetical protein O7635_10975 [Asanoa sp. WMMD1127]|uniref:hypothetical protein n=1 Tax=Asanoa sp. WMMD1127 TaxID=3016107 RepID=UPI00241612A5|nr:hypothetical protein [Asanoa sp. WMMD1127]MDG4822370.1 hypothetical protein [Asanoa sp. WMMD1127]
MTTPTTGHVTSHSTDADRRTDTGYDVRERRVHGDETKPSFKTTELVLYLAAVIGVLIASAVTGDVGNENGGDVFAADKAWWFITLLTVGYMVSRGLAKSGSRSRDTDPRNR